jgi:hypothetical protein
MAERKGRRASRGVRGAAQETKNQTGSAVNEAAGQAASAGSDAAEDAADRAKDVADRAGGLVERMAGGGGDSDRSVGEELRDIVREAALEVLAPVARRATSQAAKYAIQKAPQLARETLLPKLEEAGGPGALAKNTMASVSERGSDLLEKVKGGGEGQEDDEQSESQPWEDRKLPEEEYIDVVVPIDKAYERFMEFREHAKFMSGGETVDERENEQITWKSSDGGATAVITFHKLSDRLTRVMVTYDHQPQGFLKKTTSLLRGPRRALTADLKRYKAFVELGDGDSGDSQEGTSQGSSSAGEEQDQQERGEEEGAEDEPEGEYEDEEPEGEEDEEPEGEYEEDEPEAEEDEEPEGEEEEEPEGEYEDEEPEGEDDEEPEAEEEDEPEGEYEDEEPEGEEDEEPEDEADEEPAAEEEEEEPEEEEPEQKKRPTPKRQVRRRAPARPSQSSRR